MQTTLIEKGEINQRLQETVNTIKNQLLNDKIFDQKFSVTQVTTLKSVDYYVSKEKNMLIINFTRIVQVCSRQIRRWRILP